MDNKIFEVIYRECKPLLSFDEIYIECNLRPLFEQALKEAKTIPGNVAVNIKSVIAEHWKIGVNEDFSEEISQNVIEQASKGGLELFTSQHKKIPISNKTDKERNTALLNIKSFVDSVISICQNYISTNQNKTHQEFNSYFSDEKRVTQLYSALIKRIALEFQLPLSEIETFQTTISVPFG